MFSDDKLTHHAYVISGDTEAAYGELLRFLEDKLGIPTRGNPDLYFVDTETFAIDDARGIQDRHSERSFREGKRAFIMRANAITREAQNALLKILEEPHADAYFFILLPYSDILLPTLRSRVVVLDAASEGGADKDAKQFLKETPAARLKTLAPLIKEGDKAGAIRFLDGLEAELRGKGSAASLDTNSIRALEELIKAKDYLRDTAPSVKILLEHVALICPQK